MITLLGLLIIGVGASLVSGMIGGGSGLILTPAQLLLGIDRFGSDYARSLEGYSRGYD